MAIDDPGPTPLEIKRRDEVLDQMRQLVREGRAIPLDRAAGSAFSGSVGRYRYLFEGEEDLLHLSVRRADGGPMEARETQAVARFLLPGVPEALIWLRPGPAEHHFFLGHDLLFPL